ncbi:ImmA/IrrE family metallo-endopeptidase [Bradyrhizobium sp. 147]|uniref:ImmA/IrrE family metallo-endopeptidase n=1 Tax=Bradyrhizobium sp. 147 TaxID=2782623 RepID=UPI001FFC1290|nr:ImmA/IrrE family metallo-endopeptidase [Bradyrhizobium sp. 147]
MRRGFKSQAEKSSAAARQALGITLLEPLDPWAYAAHLQVRILDFNKLGLPASVIRQLVAVDHESWSAMTIQEAQSFGIVINPAHALTRQRSNLMHELAHIELRHVPSSVQVSETGLLLLSDYSDDQEQEADWHAAALLLPREGLMHMRSGHQSIDQIASHYGVSRQLTEWRLRMTGVEIQIRRSGAR